MVEASELTPCNPLLAVPFRHLSLLIRFVWTKLRNPCFRIIHEGSLFGGLLVDARAAIISGESFDGKVGSVGDDGCAVN